MIKKNYKCKNYIVRFLSRNMIIVAVLVAALVTEPVIVHTATVSELEKEKEELEKKKREQNSQKQKDQSELNAANEKANALEDDIDNVKSEIEEIDGELIATIASITMIEDDIVQKKEEIRVTSEEYEAAKADEESQYDSMKKRIKYMYEKGNATYTQLLVESQGFSDLMNKVEYVEKLYDYDRRLLIKYQTTKEKAFELKNELEDEESELQSALYELEEEKEWLNESLNKMREEYEDYSSRLARARSEANALKTSIAKKNAEIRKLEEASAQRQNEIDEAKRREEEERKALEAQMMESSMKVLDSQKQNGDDSSKKESEVKQTADPSSESPSGSKSKTYLPASSFNSGSVGQNMIQYAQQFIGNPYVYGGTSLTTGADCSGFVYRVYNDFGYSIPRTGQRSLGVEVSYENARPGDIFCYAGHVALYMGNGQIIHASTERTGIRIGSAMYKPIITIRRVL